MRLFAIGLASLVLGACAAAPQASLVPPTNDAGDAGDADAGALYTDAGPVDAGQHDAGVDAGIDAGLHDAGPSDAGAGDAGHSDAGAHDGGADAGTTDAGAVDAGGADAGGTDAGGASALLIYGDALDPAWFTDNWNCTSGPPQVNYAQTAVVRTGSSAVAIAQCAAYGAWVLDHRDASWNTIPFQTGQYGYLSFDVNPGNDVSGPSGLQLTLDNGSHGVALTSVATLAPNTWTHVRIPLSALNSAHTDFYRIAFFNNQDRTAQGAYSYYVDNLQLEEGSAAQPDAGSDAGAADAGATDAGATDGGQLAITVVVDGGTPISPYVYGLNDVVDTAGDTVTSRAPYAKLIRSGGNRYTGYNWENNASNSGTDTCPTACNNNDGYLGGGATPGEAVRLHIAEAHALDAGALITIPIVDYVAGDEAGQVGSTPADGGNPHFARSVAFKPADAGALSLTPDLSDGVVYQQELVNFVQSKFGGDGKPIFFSLDNEPGLWPGTHPLIHHGAPTYAEMAARTTTYGSMIKATAPQALVFGGVCYGYAEYANLQGASDANNREYLDFLLAQAKAYQDAHGTRILDVLDLHWYPEALAPNGRISDLNNTNPSAAEIDARVQAPRSLWDPGYQENSWIVNDVLHQGIKLIPRVQAKIDAQYPGTRLSFSEYNYGGSRNISGAIAQADVLGIFGRYGVFASSLWAYGFEDSPDSFVLGAFDSYLNYDGAGGAVGELALPLANPDPVHTSLYAMRSAASSAVHVIAINKTQAAVSASVTVSIGRLLTGVTAYQLTSANPRPQPAGAVTLENNHFVYAMPPLSVTTLVIR